MKLRKNKSPIWLSEITQQTILEEYPQLTSIKIQDNWIDRAQRNVPYSIRWAIIVFTLGIFLHWVLIWQGLAFSTYVLDSQTAADILASSLEYLAGLVGIILPLILIIVEFVSKDRGTSSLVDIYLEKTNLKQTAVWALILLGAEAVFMTIFRATIIKQPPILLSIIFLFTLLNLAIIFETGKTIWNLRLALSNNFLVQTLSAKLTKEIQKSQKVEVDYRISRMNNLRAYEQRGAKHIQYGYQPQNSIVVAATNTGTIIDINLSNLDQFTRLIRASENVFLTKMVHDSVQEGEPLAFVPLSMEGHHEELRRILNKSFRVKEVTGVSSGNDAIRTLMTQVKHMIETSIREENKPFFDEMMSVYHQIFELGVDLPLPPSTEWFSDFLFRGWKASQIAIWNLRDFVEMTARSSNRDFVATLSYDIYKIASLMIQHSRRNIDANFSDVLGLYVPMYIFSYKSNNDLGINRSYFYLTRDLMDRTWSNSLNHSFTDLQAVENHYTILNTILYTLAKILEQALLYEDLDTFSTLIKFMHPKELLVHFSLGNSFSHEYILLLQRQEEASAGELSTIDTQVTALRYAEEIPNYTQSYFNRLITITIGFILESYENDRLTVSQLENRLSPLRPYLLSVEDTIIIFKELVKEGLLLSSVFSQHQDTKRGYAPNDEDKIFLYCGLRGMSLLSKGEINTTLSLNLESQLSRIESTSHRIAAASFKWSQTSLFAGLDISFTELAQSWIALVIEINHRWQQERLARIIDSGLDSEKLLTFNQALENAIRVASGNGYRHLLDSYERVTYDAGSSEQIQHTRVHEKKYFTKLHDEDGHYVQALGDQYGIHMVRQGDDHLLQFFISNSRFLPTRKEWESLQPYFDRAINQFIETNHKISCFLVPHNPNLYRWLQNTPNYLPHFRLQLSEKLPMLEGLYKDIPVYGYSSQNNEMTLILALDLNRAVDLNIGEPSTEIRTYTEEEIRQRLEAHPDEPREELLSQVIVKAIQPFEVELIDRDAILRMKIKLPAIERSVFVNSN